MLNPAFHNAWHTTVKRELGASFVAFERYKDKYALRIIIDGVSVAYPLQAGSPEDVTAQNYSNLIKTLKNE